MKHIITCPHCHAEFNSSEAIIRPSKASYKWYEISEFHSFCPSCEGRYQLDIRGLAAVLFCFSVLAAFLIGYFWSETYSLVIMLVSSICLVIFPKKYRIKAM